MSWYKFQSEVSIGTISNSAGLDFSTTFSINSNLNKSTYCKVGRKSNWSFYSGKVSDSARFQFLL